MFNEFLLQGGMCLLIFLLQGGMCVRFGNGRSRCVKGNIYSFYQELRPVARGGHVMSETKGKRRGNEKEQKKKERLSIFLSKSTFHLVILCPAPYNTPKVLLISHANFTWFLYISYQISKTTFISCQL